MKILLNKEIDRVGWSAFVQASETGNWFQSSAAYEFFASQSELFQPFAYGLENEGKLRGVCCGYITVEKSVLKQMLTRRAIIIGGPALADDAQDDEVATLMSAVRKELKVKAIYVECRNFNDYSKWRSAFASAGFDYIPHLNFHVDTSSVEIAEAKMGKNRKRDIKTSFRDGAIIVKSQELKDKSELERMVHEYYIILKNLYETKVKTPLFPESFFQALAKHPDGRLLFVGLPKEDSGIEIIGGTVCVAYAGKCVYEWFVSGRDGEWKSIFPSSVATYAGIKYAAEHNCPRFDMMGAGTPDEAYGVRDFKARFGGQEVEHGRFLCVTKPLLYRIGKMGVYILKKLK